MIIFGIIVGMVTLDRVFRILIAVAELKEREVLALERMAHARNNNSEG